jgi:hypothetical protein
MTGYHEPLGFAHPSDCSFLGGARRVLANFQRWKEDVQLLLPQLRDDDYARSIKSFTYTKHRRSIPAWFPQLTLLLSLLRCGERVTRLAMKRLIAATDTELSSRMAAPKASATVKSKTSI